MDLYSCNRCGVVLDRDKVNFPRSIYNNFGEIDEKVAMWDDYAYVPKAECPVCKADIPGRSPSGS